MNRSTLITVIEQHGTRAVELGPDHLLCEENFAGDHFPDTACEFYGPYWTPILATVPAVRSWLGY